MLYKLLTSLVLIVIPIIILSQDNLWKNPNFRKKEIKTQSPIVIDSLEIIEETLVLKDSLGNIIDKNQYSLNTEASILTLSNEINNKKIHIEYYTLPNTFAQSFFSKDSTLILSDNKPIRYYQLKSDSPIKTTIFGKLKSQGSIVRGVTFGNNQNATVQSSLDLKLEGKLSNDVSIAATLFDNNINIEQGGYTQNINEFEQFYIELFNSNSKLKAGFIDINQDEDYFANFNKKVMGLEVSSLLTHKEAKTKISVIGSLSRGEYYRFQFTGIEGNQGPYKLNGKNGENFIVILPNSEKVFLEGILLQQGEDKDYIINYNTGEITFTNNRIVNSSSRYSVEYQYNTRYYNRYILYGSVNHIRNRFSIFGNIYSGSDSKNNPISQDLSDQNKQVLSQAGENESLMYASSAVQTDYSAGSILYRKINIGNAPIFEYSNDPNEILFTVGFTYFGKNKGNYNLVSTEVNGRIFEYIATVAGIPQGEYEPVKRLVAPEKLQVYSINTQYKLSPNHNNKTIGINLALSNNDENTFSSINDNNNMGFAGRIFLDTYFKKNTWESFPSFNYSFINKNFAIIDRVQSIEFSRDFNKTEEFSHVNQHFIKGNWKNKLGENFILDYSFDFIKEDTLYKGLKNTLYSKFEKNTWKIQTQLSQLFSKNSNEKSQFLRYNASVENKINNNKITLGADLQGEDNQRKHNTQTLSNLSFRWNEIGLFTHLGDSSKFNIKSRIYTRNDDSIRLGILQNISHSQGVTLSSQLLTKPYHTLHLEAHYRNINYNKDLFTLSHEDFLVGNLKWNKGFWKNGITLSVQYKLESGREAEREFQYVKVSDGLGIYKWTDYNSNGIEELDEFEVAEFQDQANYIRVFINNISYIKANKNGLNTSLSILPENIFKNNKSFWERWRSRISYSSLTSFYKDNTIANFNPFAKENTINKNENIIAQFNFNKIRVNKWDFMYKWTKYNNTRTVFLGKESQNRYSHLFDINYKIIENFIVGNELILGEDNISSELFPTKNYTIFYTKTEPSITYKIDKIFSVKGFYSYNKKENLLGIETLSQQELGSDLRWDTTKTSLSAKFSFIKNKLEGNSFSLVANQMMDGLQQGNNTVWNLLLQHELTSFLILNLNYQGRKNENNKAIHTGSVQLKAIF